MRHTLRKFSTVFALSLYIALPLISAHADDTEIYFGTGTNASARPNVLFIIDDSGSMNTQVGTTGKTRMQVVREGLLSLLDSMSNVNVGLMNFSAPSNSTNGGPVLYPVRGIDESVEQQILLQSVSNDAYQIESTTVTDGTSNLIVGEQREPKIPCGSACTEFYASNFILADKDNVDGGSTSFNTIDLGDTGNRTGLRFTGLDIPKGATILRANIRFMLKTMTDSCKTTDMFNDIQVERVDNAVDYKALSVTSSSRNLSVSVVPWVLQTPTYTANTYVYTSDLSALVQLVVNRSGWVSGNAMAFQFIESAGNDGCRDAYNRNTAPNDAAKPAIEIEWTTSEMVSKKVLTGLRFANLQIPQGAKITKANIEYVPYSAASTSAQLEIGVDDSSDSPDFGTKDIATRDIAKTMDWNEGVWAAGAAETTPDLSDMVQYAVDNSDWCGGNAVTFIISGDENRLLYAKEAALGKEAKLTVNYEPQAGAATGCIRTTLSYPVASGGDDVEERTSGSVVVNNDPLGFIVDGSNKNRAMGLRFAHVLMPVSSSVYGVDSAYLTLTSANSAGSSTTVQVGMAEDAKLSAIPTSSGGVTGISSLSSTVGWTISGWASGNQYNSPNLASLVTSAINHATWQGDNTGNTMTFVLKGDTSTSGSFAAKSFESDSIKAPRFTVTYRGRYSPAANQTVRNTLKNMVNALTPQSYTPYSGVLLEAANYYKGGDVFFGKQRSYSGGPNEKFHVSHPLSIDDGYGLQVLPTGCSSTSSTASACKNETYSGTPKYISPIIDKCQSNHIVFLTDGEPNSNTSTTAGKVQALTGASCSSSTDGKDCSTKIAQWLQAKIGSKDVRSDMDDTQSVKLHTIGFAASIPYLSSLATDGGGLYRAASDSSSLNAAFADIIGTVTTQSATFVSAGVTVDQFNRVTNSDELYFAMFEPTGQTKWHGNIKRYRMFNGTIVDSNDAAALDPSTQKFKESAQSFWSIDGDGDDVKKGGAAFVVPAPASRVVYTNLEGSSGVNLYNGNNDVEDNQATLTSAMLNATDSADRTKIINWANGMDVNNTSAPTSARNQLGDPIHSQPQVVIYDDSTADNQTILFSADNEGYLHAFNAETGVELWSWIPKDLLGQLTRFQKNTPLAKRESGANGLDGHIAPYIVDNNRNGMVDSGDKVWLMVGMRRGGNNYYLLDVSDINRPILKYTIQGGTGSFAKLGQTWAKPVFGRIRFGSTIETVAVFTGGYDEAEDSNSSPAANNSMGNAIYIVRLSDGTLLWNNAQAVQGVGAGLLSTMTHSMPAGVVTIDVSGSGFIESFYASDLRGQVFRFDVKNGESDITKIITGARIAHIGGSLNNLEGNGGVDEANNRRFFNSPAVAAVLRPDDKTYVAVALGSGYRSHPKNTANKDAFYMFRDQGVLTRTFDKDIVQADLLDITNYADPDAEISGKSVVKYIEDNNYRGWKLDLSVTTGEKVLSQALIFNNQVIFGSYIPISSNLCAGVLGGGRGYLIDINDGSIVVGNSRYTELKRAGIPADPSVYIGTYDPDGDGKAQDTKTLGLYGPEEGMDPSNLGWCGTTLCANKWRKVR